jgi:serine protease Do
VVGLTTFGSLENTGGLAAGLNFAIPVSILNEYLDTAGITPEPGRATRWFAEGLGSFDKQHYRTALKKFESVLRLNSHYPGIYMYIADCKENIKKGNNKGSAPVDRMLLVSMLLLLLGLGAGWWAGRKRAVVRA